MRRIFVIVLAVAFVLSAVSVYAAQTGSSSAKKSVFQDMADWLQGEKSSSAKSTASASTKDTSTTSTKKSSGCYVK
jgi:hypothetical protein